MAVKILAPQVSNLTASRQYLIETLADGHLHGRRVPVGIDAGHPTPGAFGAYRPGRVAPGLAGAAGIAGGERASMRRVLGRGFPLGAGQWHGRDEVCVVHDGG